MRCGITFKGKFIIELSPMASVFALQYRANLARTGGESSLVQYGSVAHSPRPRTDTLGPTHTHSTHMAQSMAMPSQKQRFRFRVKV